MTKRSLFVLAAPALMSLPLALSCGAPPAPTVVVPASASTSSAAPPVRPCSGDAERLGARADELEKKGSYLDAFRALEAAATLCPSAKWMPARQRLEAKLSDVAGGNSKGTASNVDARSSRLDVDRILFAALRQGSPMPYRVAAVVDMDFRDWTGDGRLVATYGDHVVLVDVPTGRIAARLAPWSDRSKLVLEPNKTRLAVFHKEHLWIVDLVGRRTMLKHPLLPEQSWDGAFTPDGSKLAWLKTAPSEDKRVYLLEIPPERVYELPLPEPVKVSQFRDRDQYLWATATHLFAPRQQGWVSWNLSTKVRTVHTTQASPETWTNPGPSPDLSVFGSIRGNGVDLRNAVTGTLIVRLEHARCGTPTSYDFHPTKPELVTLAGRTVCRFDTRSNRLLGTFKTSVWENTPNGEWTHITYETTGDTVMVRASVLHKYFRVSNGVEVNGHPADGVRFACGELQWVDRATGAVLKPSLACTNATVGFPSRFSVEPSVSPDGRYAVSDGVWDLRTGKRTLPLPGNTDLVVRRAATADVLWALTREGRLWQVHKRTRELRVADPVDGLSRLALVANGQRALVLVKKGDDYGLEDPKLGNTTWIRGMAADASPSELESEGFPLCVDGASAMLRESTRSYLIRIADGTVLRSLPFGLLAVSPDCTRVVHRTAGAMVVTDVLNGRVLYRVENAVRYQQYLFRLSGELLALSPEGTVVAYSADGVARPIGALPKKKQGPSLSVIEHEATTTGTSVEAALASLIAFGPTFPWNARDVSALIPVERARAAVVINRWGDVQFVGDAAEAEVHTVCSHANGLACDRDRVSDEL